MTEFQGVVPALRQALSKRGYNALTPVQKAVLATGLSQADLLVSAQTGSGKTVAFGLALAHTLLGEHEKFAQTKAPLALAVAPTRELALQLQRELQWLYQVTGATVASCVGGMDMSKERRALKGGAHIVVGTPGRLRDHIQRGSLNMTALKAVVLDEADEMLDLGFREELEFILDAAPAERRTLMFSATVPRAIATLAKRYQCDAVRIATTEEQKQHVDIEYRALTVAASDRENAIINVLRYFEAKNALVFCATRATVNHMASRFNNRGFSVVALSGEFSQKERSHALQAMRDGRAKVCIATDVAARGIDLPDLELVIHADIPKNREILLHRSGRTGRAGRKGVCTLIVPPNANKRTQRLLQSANIQAEWARPPSAENIRQRDDERLLADAALNEPLKDDERAFAQQLLDHHSPHHIAAAFVRLYRAGQSAPEELLDVARVESKPKQHNDFSNAVWFSLSVGREHSAEPRWLLPMLCGAGQIPKHHIGAIRIQPKETYVELASECVEHFLEAIGPDCTLEKSIVVTRIEGAPVGLSTNPDRQHSKQKPYKSRKRDGNGKPGAKRKHASKLEEAAGNRKTRVKKNKGKDKNKGKRSHKSRAANTGTGAHAQT